MQTVRLGWEYLRTELPNRSLSYWALQNIQHPLPEVPGIEGAEFRLSLSVDRTATV